ncbi:C4-dicarboxylate ABC transporter [bacterium]|nr:C4-dicarboxylate ABC transporter [bacterium]
MLNHALLVLGVMVVVFAVASRLKVSVELSMLLAAIAGGLAHGSGFSARHVVDGAFTYFDVTLIFLSATFFMNIVKESGGVDYIVGGIVKRFHANRFLCLLFLTFILLIPGALTGSGSVTVLVVGALAAKVLSEMGIPKEKVTAIIFLCAAMSAAAPPVNLWAMMAAAGSNMPYVGFIGPLGALSVLGALFSMFWLGWKGSPIDAAKVAASIKVDARMRGWRVGLPFAVLIALIALSRIFPHDFPILGLPLCFMLAAATAAAVSATKVPLLRIARDTVDSLLPLVGMMIVVGILVQAMSLSGVRGLISLSVVTLPLAVIIGALFVILPLSEGLVQYASAPLLGVPLILLFNMKGIDPVVALSAMAVMWPLGDILPPTLVVGRAAVMVTGYDGSYYKGFVKATLVPALFILALSTLVVIFSGQLTFLKALG